MILIDANILLYAHTATSPHHAAAVKWFDEQMSGSHPIGIPWASILAFVRLTANPTVVQPSVSAAEAWETVTIWLANRVVWIPQPTEAHADILGSLLKFALRPEHVPDAHLAALAIEHRLTLCTTDGGFSRFPGLKWKNPLQN